jgi:hypothetical protein
VITIDPSTGRATSIVVADLPPEASEQILAIAGPSLYIFARQPGFVSAALYINNDRNRLVTHLPWEGEQDHWNCMRSPDFAAMPAPPPEPPAPQFVAHLFDVVATREGAPTTVAAPSS